MFRFGQNDLNLGLGSFLEVGGWREHLPLLLFPSLLSSPRESFTVTHFHQPEVEFFLLFGLHVCLDGQTLQTHQGGNDRNGP